MSVFFLYCVKLNSIYLGNNIDVLRSFPNACVDVVFADPPYNLQLSNNLYRPNEEKYNGVEDTWDKFESVAAYDDFTKKWLMECRRVMKKDATIWVIGTYHNIFRIGKILQDLGFWILNDILWIKTNPTPNFNGTRFTNAHETIIWAARDKNSKFYFDYNAMKRFNDNTQMRSDWYLPICQGTERLKINGEKIHSTQKPESLLYRIILASSKINDTILDPFFGSGTTGAVAKRLRRNYVGIEQDETYYHAAQQRLAAVKASNINNSLFTTYSRRSATRVRFGDLLASNYLSVGQSVFSSDHKYKAKVKSDGTLTINIDNTQITGSIHQLAAHLMSRKKYNGWDYWFVEYNNEVLSLNSLRELYRKEVNGEFVETIL